MLSCYVQSGGPNNKELIMKEHVLLVCLFVWITIKPSFIQIISLRHSFSRPMTLIFRTYPKQHDNTTFSEDRHSKRHSMDKHYQIQLGYRGCNDAWLHMLCSKHFGCKIFGAAGAFEGDENLMCPTVFSFLGGPLLLGTLHSALMCSATHPKTTTALHMYRGLPLV